MSVTAAQLGIKISAEGASETEHSLKGVNSELADGKSHAGGFLSTMAGFVGGAAIVNLAGDAFNFLKGQVTDSWQAGMDANTVIAQTVAGLKSTHDVSGQTAQSIGDLATHIMNLSGIDDDAVQTGENMLLTFTNIGKKVFPQATQAVADLATKMNGGMVPSAQQMQQQSVLLGKALNDPLKGISALTRVGVTFDDQQKAQIATMMKHNDIAGAQGVILKEINKEFGGAAAAAGQANGGISILTAQFNNMKESLGQQLIPIVGKLLTALQPLIQGLAGNLTSAIAGITPLFDSLSQTFSKMPTGQLSMAFRMLEGAFDAVSKQVSTAALPILKQLGDFFQQHLLPAFLQFAGFAATTLIPMFGQIAVFVLQTVVPALLQLGAFVTDTLLPAVEQLVKFFQAHVLPVLEVLVKVFLTDVLPVLEQLAKTILTKVVPPIERMLALILPVLVPALHALGWIVTNVVGPALNFLLTVIGWLMDKFVDMAVLLSGQVGVMFSTLGTFAHNVQGWVSGLITTFTNAGRSIIQGLINGVKGMLGNAVGAVKDVGSSMLGGLKGLFGIHSPSTVFAELGANLSQGLINGVRGVDVAGPIGAHLGGAIPALAGSVNVGMTGAIVGAAGASYGAAYASAAASGGGRAQQSTFIIQLDGRTIAQNTLEHAPGIIRVGTGVRNH